MLRGELPYAPIAQTLDFSLLEVDEGRALFQGTPGRALAVYVIQGIWLGLAGATGGVLFGAAAVWAAPHVLRQILPVEVETHLSISMVWQALVFGFLLCVSFMTLQFRLSKYGL